MPKTTKKTQIGLLNTVKTFSDDIKCNSDSTKALMPDLHMINLQQKTTSKLTSTL